MVTAHSILESLSNEDGNGNEKRHKTIGLMSKNNRSARAFYSFVHFFAAICKTTTWRDQIYRFSR